MFEVSVEHTFAAAHMLRNYKGKCENLHGHNYKVRVICEGQKLDPTGLLVDFTDLKRLTRGIVDRLDHTFLNELDPFDKINPSAENIAWYFFEEISGGLKTNNGARVKEVVVWETDTSNATYRNPEPTS